MRFFSTFTSFEKLSQNKLSSNIVVIRSDNGGEFENHVFKDYCDKRGIKHNFSTPRTPQ